MEIKGTEHLTKIYINLLDPERFYELESEYYESLRTAISILKSISPEDSYMISIDPDGNYEVFIHNIIKSRDVRKLFPFSKRRIYREIAIPEWKIMHFTDLTMQGLFKIAKIDEAVLYVDYSPIMNRLMDIVFNVIFKIEERYYDPDTGESVIHVKENFKNSPNHLIDISEIQDIDT